MDIIIINNKCNNFYICIGPFLSKREIVNEIGAPVYDDDGKEWYVCIEKNKVIGFCGVYKNTICSCYVIPDRRGEGVLSMILKHVINDYKKLKTVANDNSFSVFIKSGFKYISDKGKFKKMEI